MLPLPTRPVLGPITLHPTSRPKAGPSKGSSQSVRPAPYRPVHMEPARTANPHAVARLLPIIEEFEMEDEMPVDKSPNLAVDIPRRAASPKRKRPAKPTLAPHQRVGMAKLTPLAVAAKAPVGLKPVTKVAPKKAKDPVKLKEKEQRRLEKEKKEKDALLFHERVWGKLLKLLDTARQKSICLPFIPYDTFKDKKFYTEHVEWDSLAKGRATWMVTLLEQASYVVKIRKVGDSDITVFEISGWAQTGSQK